LSAADEKNHRADVLLCLSCLSHVADRQRPSDLPLDELRILIEEQAIVFRSLKKRKKYQRQRRGILILVSTCSRVSGSATAT
jgi:hypothetical protein